MSAQMQHDQDATHRRLTDYVFALSFDKLSPEAIQAAKARLVDMLGVLLGGFSGEPCRIARSMAAQMPMPEGGATVIGTRLKTTPDMAVFANGTAVRFLDMNDNYNFPNSAHGHPSDALAAVLAAAEIAGADGRALILATVLAYEVFLRSSDMFRNHRAYDTANLTCLASAAAAGKLFGLSREQLFQCIAMAVVPNAILKQVRLGQRSMYKAVASGHGGRAGMFAAMLARAGMIGPDMPFEGDAGWCEQVARGRFEPQPFGGEGAPFKILDSRIKLRPANAGSIASILAAERIAPLDDVDGVQRVVVEVSRYTKRAVGTGDVPWNPDTREIADHSIPYLVATALIDGTVGVDSFDEPRLFDPRTRALIRKIEVEENPEFTKAYESVPVQEHARVTVIMADGRRLAGASGGGADDLSAPKSDDQIAEKFRMLTVPLIGSENAEAVLGMLWGLESLKRIGAVAERLVIPDRDVR
jgi:2-methylcitrate dehydratase